MKKKHILLKVVEEETFKFEVDDEKLNQIMSILGKHVTVSSNKTVESTQQPTQNDVPEPKSAKSVEKSNKRRRYQYDDAGIKLLLKEGKTISQIAEHFGIGTQSMRNYINGHKSQWDEETTDSEGD